MNKLHILSRYPNIIYLYKRFNYAIKANKQKNK